MSSTREYTLNNLMAFSIVGIIIKLFFSPRITVDGNSGPATSAVWGYGIVSISIFSAMFLSFALASNMKNLDKDLFGFIKELFSDSLPSLLTLMVLVWLITMNVTYFKRINQGKTSNEYSQFSNINTIFLIIQISVLFTFLKKQFSTDNTGNDNKMSYVVYAMTFLNIIILGIMNIILSFFSTDG